MDNLDRLFSVNKRDSEDAKDFPGMIFSEIRQVTDHIAYADMWFQMEDDEDLIEASIYYREFLKSRYRHLMKKAKRENLSLSPFNIMYR